MKKQLLFIPERVRSRHYFTKSKGSYKNFATIKDMKDYSLTNQILLVPGQVFSRAGKRFHHV